MKPLLLLHGALGAESQLLPLKQILSADFTVSSFSFYGHGGTELPSTYSIELFANQVYDWIRSNNIDKVSIFGYSMGGYVALYLAKKYPALINRIITLGTKLRWDEATAAKEVSMMQPEIIEAKVPKFAAELQQRHHPVDWKLVMQKTADMLQSMGKDNPLKTEDYNSIENGVLLMLGDKDKMVTLDETVNCYKQLPQGRLAVLPGTGHAIEQVDMELLSFMIKSFFRGTL
jgi:pimeloyl-ACP methyl ester carboxylesterase